MPLHPPPAPGARGRALTRPRPWEFRSIPQPVPHGCAPPRAPAAPPPRAPAAPPPPLPHSAPTPGWAVLLSCPGFPGAVRRVGLPPAHLHCVGARRALRKGGGRGDAWGRGGGGFSAKRGGSMVGIDRLNVPASDNDPRRLGPDLWGPTFGKRCPEGLGQIALSWAAEGPPVGP